MMIGSHAPTRRELLIASGALFAWAYLPKAALAEGRDPRFLVIILRGALDGLAAVAPVGDPNWLRLRGDAALTLDGPVRGLPLDGFFALHPAMPNLYQLYKAGHATILHAVATPYRQRSHFDGQDVLESGVAGSGAGISSGWLNRALGTLARADRVQGYGRAGVAVGPLVPLVIRGPANVLSWRASPIPPATDDTLGRVLDLYRHTNPVLAHALEERLGLAAIAGANSMTINGRASGIAKNVSRVRAYFSQTAGTAAKFLAQPTGPRIGALAFDGWDTHAYEGPVDGRLSFLLGALDEAIGAIKVQMGPAWGETVVAIATEFGRTAHVNGTKGTDHGTATVALLVGGALKGGRVLSDWPGLSDADLYEGRDLKPTMDLRAVFKGLLKDHLRVPELALETTVFPDSAAASPMRGLLA